MNKSGGSLKHFVAAFLVTLAAYAAFFAVDQHIRHRKGAWDVAFDPQNSGGPAILVNQPALGISNVKIVFGGDSLTNAAPGAVLFDFPKKPLPFGRMKFEDLTYLPGSVTFDFFGHEVELLPRTLIVNRKELGWTSAKTYSLSPADKIPNLREPKRKGER